MPYVDQMADAKILDRIEKLLRLATDNPNEAEASQAALKAAQLMKEHGLRVGDKPRSGPAVDVTAMWMGIYKHQWQREQSPPPRQGNPWAWVNEQGREKAIEAEVRRRLDIKLAELQVEMAPIEMGYHKTIAEQQAKLAKAAETELTIRGELAEVYRTMREAIAENIKLSKMLEKKPPVGFWYRLVRPFLS